MQLLELLEDRYADEKRSVRDMTDEQLITARSNIAAYTSALGYAKPNLDFKTGFIEDLEGAGVEKDSVDLCISNCTQLPSTPTPLHAATPAQKGSAAGRSP